MSHVHTSGVLPFSFVLLPAHLFTTFLGRYNEVGGQLTEHEDLSKRDPEAGPEEADTDAAVSTHTLIIYLSGRNGKEEAGDCGGQTVLLRGFTPPEGIPDPLSECEPIAGRILLFPHACPHLARPVLAPPKVILRGECLP
jgi:hypothetical protein